MTLAPKWTFLISHTNPALAPEQRIIWVASGTIYPDADDAARAAADYLLEQWDEHGTFPMVRLAAVP